MSLHVLIFRLFCMCYTRYIYVIQGMQNCVQNYFSIQSFCIVIHLFCILTVLICLKFIKTMTSFVVDKLLSQILLVITWFVSAIFLILGQWEMMPWLIWSIDCCMNALIICKNNNTKCWRLNIKVFKYINPNILTDLIYCLRIGWHHVHEDDEFIIQDNQII